jgi:hypothetical protein
MFTCTTNPHACRPGPSKNITSLSSMFLMPLIPKSKSVRLRSEVAREVFCRHSRSMRCARYLMANEAFVSLEFCVRLAVMGHGGRVATMRVLKNMHGKRLVTHTANHAVHKRTDACVRACVRKQGWQGGPKRSFSIRSSDVHSGVFVVDNDRGQINVCRAFTYVTTSYSPAPAPSKPSSLS